MEVNEDQNIFVGSLEEKKITLFQKFYCVVPILMWTFSPVFGATISGKVIRNGNPVSGAYVQILDQKGQELDTWTDNTGKYLIEEIWKGNWTIRISSSEAEAVSQTQVNILDDNQEVVLADQFLDGVSTVVSQRVKNIFTKPFQGYNEEKLSFHSLQRREIPRIVSIFTKKHIFDAGIGTFEDFYTSMPGMYPTESQGNSFSTRGIWGKENIFVNGMSIGSLPLLSDLFLQPDFMDRIEILKEPGSFFSSQLQRGGMVNIVLREPNFSETLVGVSLVSDWTNPIKSISASISAPIYKNKTWVVGGTVRIAYGQKSFGLQQTSSSAVLVSPSLSAHSKRGRIKSDFIYGVLRGVADPGVSSLLTKPENVGKIQWSRPVTKDDRLQGDLLLGSIDAELRILEKDKGYLAYRVILNMLHKFSFENFDLKGYKWGESLKNDSFAVGKIDISLPKKGFDFETQLKLFVDTPFLKNDFLGATKVGFSRKGVADPNALGKSYNFLLQGDDSVVREDLIFRPNENASSWDAPRSDSFKSYFVVTFANPPTSLKEDHVLWGMRFFDQIAIWQLRMFAGMRYDLSIPIEDSHTQPIVVKTPYHNVVSEAGFVLDVINNRFGLQYLSAYFDCSSGFLIEDRGMRKYNTAFLDGGIRGKFMNGYTFSVSLYKNWDDRDSTKYVPKKYWTPANDNKNSLTTTPFLLEYMGVEGEAKGRVIPGVFVGGWYNFCTPILQKKESFLTEYVPRHTGRFWILTKLPITIAKGIFTRVSLYGSSSRTYYVEEPEKTVFPPEVKLDIALGYTKKFLNVQLEFLNLLNKPLWKVSEDVVSAHPSFEGLFVRGAVRLSF